MKNLWLIIFIAFSVGIAVAYHQAWLILLFMIILLFTAAILYKSYFPTVISFLIVVFLGMGYLKLLFVPIPATLDPIENACLSGRIVDHPRYDGQKTSFIMEVDKAAPYQNKLRVTAYCRTFVNRGDKIIVNGKLQPPRQPSNPGGFNYPAYLAHQGIFYICTVKKTDDIKIISHADSFLKGVDCFRHRGEELSSKILPDRETSILMGMLLGKKEAIDPERYEDFQKMGIVHLFAVSGLHVGFLLLLNGWLSTLLGISPRTKMITGIILLILYGTMVGWPVSVRRAALMGSLGLIAYYSGRKNSLINVLAISGIIILLINPCSLFTISFQLSFLATWGLIYLFPLLRDIFPRKGRAWDMILLPVSAQLAVLPLTAFYFNLFTPVSIISNILVSYLAGGAVILGFLAFLSSFFPLLATAFLLPAGMLVELILLIVELIKLIPAGYLRVATPGPGLLLMYFIALSCLVFSIKRKSFRSGITALASFMLFILLLLLPAGVHDRGIMEIVFIDVGQGDAILIKTPQGKFILIDGGGSYFYDVGKNTLLPYLYHRGIRKIDLLINTHPDNDHLDGIETVVKDMKTAGIAVPTSLYNDDAYRYLKIAAKQKHVPVIGLHAGQQIELGGARLEVMYPGSQEADGQDYNDNSLVCRVSLGKFSILLTGDIEAKAIEDLQRNGRLRAATVVKVPHHGSKSSADADFYRYTMPQYAVISVGRNNCFGHPHQKVIDILANQQIRVLRTDRDGAIILQTDGKELRVKRTLPLEK